MTWLGPEGCVYLLERDNGDIKIGWTSQSVGARESQLVQENKPNAVWLIDYFPASRATESALHKRFGHLRLSRRGEWFTDAPEIRDLFESHRAEREALERRVQREVAASLNDLFSRSYTKGGTS